MTTLFLIGYSGIYKGGKIMSDANNDILINNNSKSSEPIFMDLKFECSVENADVSIDNFNKVEDFTFWTYFYGNHQEVAPIINNLYKVELPYIDTEDRRRQIVISVGRRLKSVYYYEESKELCYTGYYMGRPVFEEEYFPNTIFAYTINTIDSFGIEEEFLNDLDRFNFYKNIPYEVKPYDPSEFTGPGKIDKDTGLPEGYSY